MKKLRVTYNYHSKRHDKYMRRKMTFLVADFEVEDCLQEFDAFSHHFPLNKESDYILLNLLSVLCTGQIFLAGDVVDEQDRENIYCITDVKVLE